MLALTAQLTHVRELALDMLTFFLIRDTVRATKDRAFFANDYYAIIYYPTLQ